MFRVTSDATCSVIREKYFTKKYFGINYRRDENFPEGLKYEDFLAPHPMMEKHMNSYDHDVTAGRDRKDIFARQDL